MRYKLTIVWEGLNMTPEYVVRNAETGYVPCGGKAYLEVSSL